MSENTLYAGPALRRLRRQYDLTQAAMAAQLGISPSYLNLLERNQRAISARIMLGLIDQFDFDPRKLEQEAPGGGVSAMKKRLSDPIFSDLHTEMSEIEEWLALAPATARAFARLYDQRKGDDQSSPLSSEKSETHQAILLIRREIERWKNHFPELEQAAEELADELRLSGGDLYSTLADRLRARHQLTIRILPEEVMPGQLRRLDLHARQFQLSEMLDNASRRFQLGYLIAQLEYEDMIAPLISGAKFNNSTAEKLFQRHLYGYFSAAIMMPYGRFLRACDQSQYDILTLQRRFGAGFEQVAHRLTTLQRVGARGLPFFMVRIDRAGQFSKRYGGASQSPLASQYHLCPLWNISNALARPGEIQLQLVECEDDSLWFTISRSVQGIASGANGTGAQFAIALGIRADHAGNLGYARGQQLERNFATPIGSGCAQCLRADCLQRALPPNGAELQFDQRHRALPPFSFQRNGE